MPYLCACRAAARRDGENESATIGRRRSTVGQSGVFRHHRCHAEALNAGVSEALSRAGVSQIVTRETQNAYRAIARLNTIDRQGNGLTARLTLSLLAPNGNIVWSQTVPARAASYAQKSETALINRAIASALRDLAPALRAILLKQPR